MVLPLIPLVLIGIGAASGAGGAALGAKGGYDIKKANDRIGKATERYGHERSKLETDVKLTNTALAALGTQQENAVRDVVERMADFLRRHEKQVSENERVLVDGLESAEGQVSISSSLGQDAVAWMRGVAGSAIAGVGINVGLTSAVTTLATASTGTAISTLSGAAATNATMAALGGGSIASGGAGIAAGTLALNFVTIGPAILVSGFVVAGQGEKAQTRARETEARVEVAIAQMELTKAKFKAVVARVEELECLLGDLTARAVDSLDVLESEPFDTARHAARFQTALMLTVAVRDVASTPIINDSGDLDAASEKIQVRYRTLMKEPRDG